jgi:hypothetical protein
MAMPEKWTRGYRPDPAIVELIEELMAAALRGEIRSIAVVTINPMLELDRTVAGTEDETGVRKRLLAAGLIEVSNTLLK